MFSCQHHYRTRGIFLIHIYSKIKKNINFEIFVFFYKKTMILIKTVLVDKIYENALLIFESMIFLVYREMKRVRRIKCEKE